MLNSNFMVKWKTRKCKVQSNVNKKPTANRACHTNPLHLVSQASYHLSYTWVKTCCQDTRSLISSYGKEFLRIHFLENLLYHLNQQNVT